MPAVTTKFTVDDKLDLKMFETNINAQLEAGVHGIILGGTLGEASTLEPEEMILKSFKISAHRVPVIINIAEQSTRGAIAIAQHAERERVVQIIDESHKNRPQLPDYKNLETAS